MRGGGIVKHGIKKLEQGRGEGKINQAVSGLCSLYEDERVV